MANTPTAAISTDSGEATPPPLPEALITPTTSGITKAEEKTGPMNPTDWAMTSGSDRTFAPRRSYPASDLAIEASLVLPGSYGSKRSTVKTVRSRPPEGGDLGRQLAAEHADPGRLVHEL